MGHLLLPGAYTVDCILIVKIKPKQVNKRQTFGYKSDLWSRFYQNADKERRRHQASLLFDPQQKNQLQDTKADPG